MRRTRTLELKMVVELAHIIGNLPSQDVNQHAVKLTTETWSHRLTLFHFAAWRATDIARFILYQCNCRYARSVTSGQLGSVEYAFATQVHDAVQELKRSRAD